MNSYSAKVMMPAGRYIVTDLCYVKELKEDWETFCHKHLFKDADRFNFQGYEGWWHDTAYGDGGYLSNTNSTFDVDAGLIGILRQNPDNPIDEQNFHIYESSTDFEVYYEDGTFHIGELEIYTKEDDDECLYEDEEDSYDEDEDDEEEEVFYEELDYDVEDEDKN